MTPHAGALLPHLPVLAFAALLPALQPHRTRPTLPATLCSTPLSGDTRPASVVSVLRSEAVGGGSDRRITTLLVHFPPHAFTPRHIHGGALTAYVLAGRVRSQLGAGPLAELRQGDTFYEAVGTIHTFIENPDDEPADVLATIVHEPGAALTTMTP
jgi:quercetin dioxygenase-like cupin family protein